MLLLRFGSSYSTFCQIGCILPSLVLVIVRLVFGTFALQSHLINLHCVHYISFNFFIFFLFFYYIQVTRNCWHISSGLSDFYYLWIYYCLRRQRDSLRVGCGSETMSNQPLNGKNQFSIRRDYYYNILGWWMNERRKNNCFFGLCERWCGECVCVVRCDCANAMWSEANAIASTKLISSNICCILIVNVPDLVPHTHTHSAHIEYYKTKNCNRIDLMCLSHFHSLSLFPFESIYVPCNLGFYRRQKQRKCTRVHTHTQSCTGTCMHEASCCDGNYMDNRCNFLDPCNILRWSACDLDCSGSDKCIAWRIHIHCRGMSTAGNSKPYPLCHRFAFSLSFSPSFVQTRTRCDFKISFANCIQFSIASWFGTVHCTKSHAWNVSVVSVKQFSSVLLTSMNATILQNSWLLIYAVISTGQKP